MRKIFKNESGITLVVLVITIIILLILTGITINMISGEHGIITKAKEAKERTENAMREENETLSMLENYINGYYDVEENSENVEINKEEFSRRSFRALLKQ